MVDLTKIVGQVNDAVITGIGDRTDKAYAMQQRGMNTADTATFAGGVRAQKVTPSDITDAMNGRPNGSDPTYNRTPKDIRGPGKQP